MLQGKQTLRSTTSVVKSIAVRSFVTNYAYKVAKGMMPKISPTERAALNAGTVGFDGNIFTGNPSLEDLRKYSIKSSPEEQGR